MVVTSCRDKLSCSRSAWKKVWLYGLGRGGPTWPTCGWAALAHIFDQQFLGSAHIAPTGLNTFHMMSHVLCARDSQRVRSDANVSRGGRKGNVGLKPTTATSCYSAGGSGSRSTSTTR